MQDIETLIVGAGPVGMALALNLHQYGRPCRIVDQATQPSTWSKALVLWPRTLEILDGLGLADRMVAAGHRVAGVQVLSGPRSLLRMRFDSLPSPFPFGLILPQNQTEHLLLQALDERGIQVERPLECRSVRVFRDAVETVLHHADGSEATVRSRWLVGCDGAHSMVRHQVQAEFEGHALETRFALADVAIDGPITPDEVAIHWTRDGVLAFFPIAPPLYRLVVAPFDPEPTLAGLQQFIESHGLRQYVMRDPIWLSSFHIHQRQVSDYRFGPVLLAGDAAHVHSPAGGQGLNTGVQDAHNLAWKLAQAGRHPALEDRLLDSYSSERHRIGAQVLRSTDALTAITTLQDRWLRKLRDGLVPLLARAPAVREAILNQFTELSINYRGGPLNHASRGESGGRVQTGDRAPDGPMGDGQTLFGLFKQAPFTLLGFSVPAAALEDVRRVATAELQCVAVSSGDLQRLYDLPHGGFVLVRPDGYVGVVAAADVPVERLLAWLADFGAVASRV